MAQPKNRCSRKLPPAAPRTMGLLGIGKDGQLYLWEAAEQVQPVSTFQSRGSGIVSGHYVIEHGGKAITVHCSNMADGRVGLLFMCGGLSDIALGRKTVEMFLLGRVVPDRAKDAEILRLLRECTDAAIARQTAPHRKRGAL